MKLTRLYIRKKCGVKKAPKKKYNNSCLQSLNNWYGKVFGCVIYDHKVRYRNLQEPARMMVYAKRQPICSCDCLVLNSFHSRQL